MIHGAKWETPPVGPGLGGMLITSLRATSCSSQRVGPEPLDPEEFSSDPEGRNRE